MKMQEMKDPTLKVRETLIHLQREILSHLKDTFEKENARTVSPAEWLQVIMVSQRYIWLRELTSLIADIDLLTELQEISSERAMIVRHEIERLFFIASSDSDFSKEYRNLMKAEAPFIITQGFLKEATLKLPSTKSPVNRQAALDERKEWYEEHKAQSRKRRS
jgi:hypothetical protein